jgi:hypothetical protein
VTARGRVARVARRSVPVGLVVALAVGCTRDADEQAARGRRKAAVAVAARDRALLQAFVRDADALDARLPALRRVETGWTAADSAIVAAGWFAGDTLLVLDENVRTRDGGTGQARYVFDGARLRYVALDRMRPAVAGRRPERLRLALGFDTSHVLVASSKNVDDGAVALDSVVDVAQRVAHAAALRTRLSAAAAAPAASGAPR